MKYLQLVIHFPSSARSDVTYNIRCDSSTTKRTYSSHYNRIILRLGTTAKPIKR